MNLRVPAPASSIRPATARPGGARLSGFAPPPGREPGPLTAPTPLWLGVHFPMLALEVRTRGSDVAAPCVLATGEGRRRRVLLANRHAAALGIRAGMPLAAAHALGDLTVLERDAGAERRALERLALWAMQISPLVSRRDDGGLVLEIRGSLKLFGGLDALLNRLRQGLRRLGYRADYAVAPTPLAAALLARFKPRRVVLDPAELKSVLAMLPVTALPLERGQAAALEGLGIRRIGECRRLPRDGLARRLSPDFVDLLDRLAGDAPDPQHAVEAPRRFDAELDLPWEVDNARALVTAGQRLLEELGGYLAANAATTRSLTWRLHGIDRKFDEFEVRLTRPGRDITHMLLLLREVLTRKTLRVPTIGIGLRVVDLRFDSKPMERDLFARTLDGGAEQEAYAAFVDRLRSRCGERALRSLGVRSTHKPEQAWCWQPAVDVPQRRVAGLARSEGGAVRRPLWLLRRAVRLGVDDDGRPSFGGPLSLVRDRERIVNGWWDGAEIARDYFVATAPDGGRLWIYRELDGARRWFLHGIFD
ncbi:MAG: Y-family DNA polymerase [Gammaproteobacteria bacterium]